MTVTAHIPFRESLSALAKAMRLISRCSYKYSTTKGTVLRCSALCARLRPQHPSSDILIRPHPRYSSTSWLEASTTYRYTPRYRQHIAESKSVTQFDQIPSRFRQTRRLVGCVEPGNISMSMPSMRLGSHILLILRWLPRILPI